MSQSINRRWINIVLIAALLISLMPTGLLAQSLPPTVDPTAKSAAEVYGQFDGDIHTAQDLAAKTAQKSPQSAQPGVTAAQALAKLHPGLRTVAQSAAPALPAVDGMQATAVQEPILVQVALRVQANPSAKETVPDLSAYFVDGKVYARPAFGKGEFKVQMFRFVDAFPMLRTPETVFDHLQDYLSQPGVTVPPVIATPWKITAYSGMFGDMIAST